MSPRPGGPADKIGNRYEGYWTVSQLLYVLAGHVEWVRVEPIGDLGEGVEFVLRRADGQEEAHQVKRQRGNENEWTASALGNLNVWDAARRHIDSGREYHLVSTVPFRPLQELTDRARDSNDFASFTRDRLPQVLDRLFVTLSGTYGKPDVAWSVLRRFHVRLIDEVQLRRTNEAFAGVLLDGASGAAISATLGDVIDNSIDAKMTSDHIVQALRPYKIGRRLGASQQGLAERIHAESSAWLARVGQQLMQPPIERSEANDLWAVTEQPERVHFCLGAAGGGKTAVLHQAVDGLMQDGIPTLVFRLDRFAALPSTTELGRQMGLEVSPVTALAAAAGGSPAVLVVDQVDAVSLASGRLPENFDIVANLVAEAAAIPNVHIVLGCRQFDVDNDHRIRNLRQSVKPRDFAVGLLSDEQINLALQSMQLDATRLTEQQRKILRLPLHLSLLATVAHEADALDFSNSQRLFDAYWNHKRQAVLARRPDTRFNDVLRRLTDVMSTRQRLQVPASLLDIDELSAHAEVLVSEQLLVRDKGQLGFFHEALFDYAFARQWVNRDESLVAFLLAGDQELFRRAQVRQIMVHLRGSDEDRFVQELAELLAHDDIRFHIKDVALAVLGVVTDPSSDEASLLVDITQQRPAMAVHVWHRLRTAPWFTRLDTDGYIASWLRGTEDEQNRALIVMVGAASGAGDRLAELLHEHQDVPQYPGWLRSIAWRAPLAQNRAIFDLFIDGTKRGLYDGAEHDMWLSAHDVGEHQSAWAVEVLHAFLVERPGALQVASNGKMASLEGRDHQATELVRQAAAGAPQEFCDVLLPYVLQVMAVTAYSDDTEPPIKDAQFSYRFAGGDDDYREFDDALYLGMGAAITTVVSSDSTASRAMLDVLAADPHDSAQWLLYQGLTVIGRADADWAAGLLLEGNSRLLCGNMSNSVWATREVLLAIAGDVSDEVHQRLESVVRDLRFPWESRPWGWSAFNLLSALSEERLTPVGRRRLGELRRLFKAQQPASPVGVFGGIVESPIEQEAAGRMGDANWLQAMAKHATDRENFRTFTGGARELSHQLQAQTAADPVRFAKLALHFTAETHPAYGDAILMGLADGEPVEDDEPVFAAVRHLASLGREEYDRWLGYGLRRYVKTLPIDLVELVRDRAIAAVDPAANDGRFTRKQDGRERQDLWMAGINGARGSLADALGDILIVDVDGSRTALVAPVLPQMAQDPVLAVRTCVANTILGALRYDRPAAVESFRLLVDADDPLLAAQPVVRLMAYLGNGDPEVVRSVISRMLVSVDDTVREAGGELVMRGALSWGFEAEMQEALATGDLMVRKGIATMAALSLPHTSNAELASEVLLALCGDEDEEVRAAVAKVAGGLRGHPLRPFAGVLQAVMHSPAFRDAHTQLFFTLEAAPDRIDDLALLWAQRFIAEFADEAGDIRTGAAGDARHVGQLMVRGLAQSKSRNETAALLDVLDGLLLIGAYGIEELVNESERPD